MIEVCGALALGRKARKKAGPNAGPGDLRHAVGGGRALAYFIAAGQQAEPTSEK
jgi:hypothetical protein